MTAAAQTIDSSVVEAGSADYGEASSSSQRQEQARKAVRNSMYLASGIGFVPIPVVDLVGAGTTQLLMIRRLCKIYDVPFSNERFRAIVAALLGGSESALIIGSLLKSIPGPGYLRFALPNALASGAITYAIGQVFTRHFELGGNLLDFDVDKMREFFAQQVKEANKVGG